MESPDDSKDRQPGTSAVVGGALAILVAVWLAHRTGLEAPWLFDDIPGICENLSIRSWKTLDPGALLRAARPLTLLTFAANYQIGGLEVRGYHITNVILHAIAALLLLGVVRRTLERLDQRPRLSSIEIAAGTALLWSVHPLLTESVTYIWQRAESLMGLFYLLAVYAAIRGEADPRARWTLLAVGAFVLGMAAKPVMITAPLMILLHDRQFGAGTMRRAFTRRPGLYLGLLGPWLLAVTAGLWLSSRTPSAGFSVTEVTPWIYACTQAGVILHGIRLCLWPAGLCFDPLWPFAPGLAAVLPQAIAVSLLLVLTAIGSVKRRPESFLGIWFFLILAPTSSVMPLWDAAAEHRFYLSSASVVLAVVVAASRLLHRRAFVPALLAAAILLGRATASRNVLYTVPLDLWTDTVSQAPWNPRALMNQGILLAEAGRVPEATVAFQRAIAVKPDLALAHANLGVLLASQGRLEEAIDAERTALRLDQANWSIPYNLAHYLLRLSRVDEAIPFIRRAIQLNPYAPFMYTEFPAVLTRAGRPREAQEIVEIGKRHLKAIEPGAP